MAQIMNAMDARKHFASAINLIARNDERVVEKIGIPVGGIVSADDFRRLDQLDQEQAERFSTIDIWRASDFEIMVVTHLLCELASTLADRYSRARVSRQVDRIVPLLRTDARRTPPTTPVPGWLDSHKTTRCWSQASVLRRPTRDLGPRYTAGVEAHGGSTRRNEYRDSLANISYPAWTQYDGATW